jgi:hypothetical protein
MIDKTVLKTSPVDNPVRPSTSKIKILEMAVSYLEEKWCATEAPFLTGSQLQSPSFDGTIDVNQWG